MNWKTLGILPWLQLSKLWKLNIHICFVVHEMSLALSSMKPSAHHLGHNFFQSTFQLPLIWWYYLVSENEIGVNNSFKDEILFYTRHLLFEYNDFKILPSNKEQKETRIYGRNCNQNYGYNKLETDLDFKILILVKRTGICLLQIRNREWT